MESKYAMDEFWLQKLDFKRKVDASSFTSLHEARALVNNIFAGSQKQLGCKRVDCVAGKSDFP